MGFNIGSEFFIIIISRFVIYILSINFNRLPGCQNSMCVKMVAVICKTFSGFKDEASTRIQYAAVLLTWYNPLVSFE